jgi:flagellar export protein FliJ
MAGFVFDLEAVLDQRAARERERQFAVAQLERQRLDTEARLRQTRLLIESGRNALRRALAGERSDHDQHRADLRAARADAASALRLAAAAQRLAVSLAGVHSRLDRARLDLLQAAIDRKAVETLRQRQFERWKAEQNRRENAAVDELTVMRGGRTQDSDSVGEAA